MADNKEAAKDEDDKPAEGDVGAEGVKKDPLAFLAFLPAKLRLPALIGAPVLLIILIVLGLLLGGVIGKKPKPPEGQAADGTMTEGVDADADAKGDKDAKSFYYNLPDMLVNLDSRGRKQSILKMSVTLELSSAEDLKAIEEKVPKVLDEFQVFLREARIEDLRGSAGIYRMRQELLARVKPAVAPIKVRDVLFKELLVQ